MELARTGNQKSGAAASPPPVYSPLYCDNASTSFPKAPGVAEAIVSFLSTSSASHSRRGHSDTDAGQELIETVRTRLLSIADAPPRSSAILTLNATDAINYALRGFLMPGAHVLTSGFEHSAVARTLVSMSRDHGIEVEVVESRPGQRLRVADLAPRIKPGTALVVFALNNNVTGDRVPDEELGPWLRGQGITYMLDAAQSIASVPLSMSGLSADILAFSCHKSLLGPPGVGCLIKRESVPLRIVRTGGTGRRAESDDPEPKGPSDYETGTQNTIGAAGLRAALEYLETRGLTQVMNFKRVLAQRFIDAIRDIPGITAHGALGVDPVLSSDHLPTVSLTIEGMSAAEAGAALDHGFGVVTRTGLHCSPWTHRRLGTVPEGTIRFSFGAFQTSDDVDYIVDAFRGVVRSSAFWATK